MKNFACNREDKRNLIEQILIDPDINNFSDRYIAEVSEVSPSFVNNVRKDLKSRGIKFDDVRVTSNGKEMKVSNIGRKPERRKQIMEKSAKKSFGRKHLKGLVQQAKDLGNSVSFYINESGKYRIKTIQGLQKPPTACAACHYLMGMIDASRPPQA